MKEELKDEWVKRLRSGTIPQTTGSLTKGDARCCLGVACDIAVDNKMAEIVNYDAKNMEYLDLDENYADSLLSYGIREWLGMSTIDGILPFSERRFLKEDLPEFVSPNEEWENYYGSTLHENATLANLNDEGFTFDQIADLIECFWQEL